MFNHHQLSFCACCVNNSNFKKTITVFVACSALVRLLPSFFFSTRVRLAFPSPSQAASLTIERNTECKPKPEPSTLLFGKQFSDHMLTINWSEKGGWESPQIKPFQNLSLHPASSALHYSIEVKSTLPTCST